MEIIKVVARQNSGLFSSAATGKAAVRYVPGVPAEPPDWLARLGFGLFAYRTAEDAVGNGLEPGLEVWLAEGIDSMPLPPACLVRELSLGVIVHISEPAWHPAGSLTFRRIVLIKKLWPPDGWSPPNGIGPFWVPSYRETLDVIYAVLGRVPTNIGPETRNKPEQQSEQQPQNQPRAQQIRVVQQLLF